MSFCKSTRISSPPCRAEFSLCVVASPPTRMRDTELKAGSIRSSRVLVLRRAASICRPLFLVRDVVGPGSELRGYQCRQVTLPYTPRCTSVYCIPKSVMLNSLCAVSSRFCPTTASSKRSVGCHAARKSIVM